MNIRQNNFPRVLKICGLEQLDNEIIKIEKLSIYSERHSYIINISSQESSTSDYIVFSNILQRIDKGGME